MANSSLKSVIKRFEERLSSSEELFKSVYAVASGDEPAKEGCLSRSQSSRVVSLAFLQMVTAWEDFVECIFLRYMVGAESPSGYKPRLLQTKPKNLDAAFELLCEGKKLEFLNWSNSGKIRDRAKIYFEKGKPFQVIQGDHFKNMFIIRNRIAHCSGSSKKAFIKLAKSYRNEKSKTNLKGGFRVDHLLVECPTRHWPKNSKQSLFLHYVCLLRQTGLALAPR
jgi:hypothetical protein